MTAGIPRVAFVNTWHAGRHHNAFGWDDEGSLNPA